jgi:hypothetical protein
VPFTEPVYDVDPLPHLKFVEHPLWVTTHVSLPQDPVIAHVPAMLAHALVALLLVELHAASAETAIASAAILELVNVDLARTLAR